MPKIIVLVGPPGSGKSTAAYELESHGVVRVSQDDQGKQGHLDVFEQAVKDNKSIVVDRMNFSHQQRNRYLLPKRDGYTYEIQVFHQPSVECALRCLTRTNHPTIKTQEDIDRALDFFFTHYERVKDYEAGAVIRHYPDVDEDAVICDLDGTLCNIDHRLKYVKEGNKNWGMFFSLIKNDSLNTWCRTVLAGMYENTCIVLCSGRGNEYRAPTIAWLKDYGIKYDHLFMRYYKDHRQDTVIKEIILDFEIKTRYNPILAIDDRQSVVDMWRRNGIVCLQCAKGDF